MRQVQPSAASGEPYAIYSVFDGHGGNAVSEWLKDNLSNMILEEWPKAGAYTRPLFSST
jgi:serine/threonine protein phosphatase PrpC